MALDPCTSRRVWGRQRGMKMIITFHSIKYVLDTRLFEFEYSYIMLVALTMTWTVSSAALYCFF